MFERFYPTVYVPDAYGINYERLYADGYRAIIWDVDNTLVTHGAPADERAVRLFERIKALGFSCTLLSNNDEARVKMFNDAVGVSYIYKAQKPKPDNYRLAMNRMGSDETTTVFIGDQIFTDIFGANNANIPSIMVAYIDRHEEIQIVLKRRLEAIVLFFYRRFVCRQDSSDPKSAAYWRKRYYEDCNCQ